MRPAVIRDEHSSIAMRFSLQENDLLNKCEAILARPGSLGR